MALNIETNSTNSKRFMKESASKIGYNIEGTMLTTFNAREENNYWIIDNGWSNHMTSDKNNFLKLEKFKGGLLNLRTLKEVLLSLAMIHLLRYVENIQLVLMASIIQMMFFMLRVCDITS
jgi:hypothetical protein